jgi:putative hydrolase of the HAD superfamily
VNFDTLFVDLDDTLYPSSSGLWQSIRSQMELYLHERLGYSWETVASVREALFLKYGTTLRALQELYSIDTEEYLAFVHNVTIPESIQPKPILNRFFGALSVQKFIFTNATVSHARRLLKRLSLENDFHGIIDIQAMDPSCKPQIPSFMTALRIAGNPDPKNCMLVDDSPRNLEVARELGLCTVLIQEDGLGKGFDGNLSSIDEFPAWFSHFSDQDR